jgi:hypothetical protein
MAYGDYAKGEMRLETVIDSESEDFKKAWKTGEDEFQHMGAINAEVPSLILKVVLKCAIERSAWEAFSKTDMRGDGWAWNFFVDDPPVEAAALYLTCNRKIRIRSTAYWSVSDAGEYGKFLIANIGDFVIAPVK